MIESLFIKVVDLNTYFEDNLRTVSSGLFYFVFQVT